MGKTEEDFDREAKERRELAKAAVLRYLGEQPQPLTAVFNHFFPPSPLPFTQEDLRYVILELLHVGTVSMDTERIVSITPHTGSATTRSDDGEQL